MTERGLVGAIVSDLQDGSPARVTHALESLATLAKAEEYSRLMLSVGVAEHLVPLIMSQQAGHAALAVRVAGLCCRHAEFCHQFVGCEAFQQLASLSTLAVDSAHGLAFVLASASQYPDLHDRLHGTLPLARALHCCAGPATPTAAAVATTVANLCATERHHGALLQPPLPRLLGDLVKDCGQDAEGQPVVLQVLRAVWNLVRSAATKQCPAFSSCVPLLEAIGALPHLSSEGLQLLLKIIGGITFRYTAADVPITWSFDLLGHECANDREPAAQLLAVTAVSNLSVYVATTPTCNILLPVDEALWVTLLNSGPPPLALNVLRLCANLSAAGYPLNDLRSAITQLSMGLESKGGGRPSVGSLVSSNTAAKFYVTAYLNTLSVQQRNNLLLDTHSTTGDLDPARPPLNPHQLLTACLDAGTDLEAVAANAQTLCATLRYSAGAVEVSLVGQAIRVVEQLEGAILALNFDNNTTTQHWVAAASHCVEALYLLAGLGDEHCEALGRCGGVPLLMRFVPLVPNMALKSALLKLLAFASHLKPNSGLMVEAHGYRMLQLVLQDIVQKYFTQASVRHGLPLLTHSLQLLCNLTTHTMHTQAAKTGSHVHDQLLVLLSDLLYVSGSDEVLANSGEGLLLLHALLLRAFTNLILLLGRPVALPALLGPVLQSLLGAQHHLNCVLEATRTVALLSTEAAYRGVVADEQVLQRLTDLLTLAPDVLMALARPGNAEDRGAAPMPYAPLPAAGARPPVERWVFQAPPPPEPAAAPPSNRLRDALGAAQSPEARDVIHIDMPGPAPAADRAPDPPGSPAPAPAREPAAGVTPVVFWGELLKYVLVALANVCVPDGLEERAVRAGAQGRVVALLRQVKELTEHSAQASARYAQKFENVYEGWEPSSSSPRRARLQPCDSNLVKWLGLALTNITNTEYSQEQFQTTGGVDVAVAILLAATDPTVLVNLLTALANVCLHPQVSEKVAQHPQAVYAMLRCCMLPHAEVQRRALQGLANLSAAEANCRVLARHDVLPALQAAAERGGPDRHAQCYVAGTLANFAENGLGARVAAGRGVDLLLLLGRTPSEPVQTAVARALAALAQDEALQPVLARSGGLALLVDMARSPYVAVQAQAGAALAAFAQPAVGAAAPPRAAPPARPQCVVC